MKTESCCLALSLFLIAGCTATKMLHEWRDADETGARFGHLVVVALFEEDQTRRMFEDEFAWQISNRGPMVTRSYNLVPSLNADTAGRIVTVAPAMGADGVLAIRMVACNPNAPPAPGRARATTENLAEFLQTAWKDNYDPPDPAAVAVLSVESRLFNARSGRPAWALATESKNQLGLKHEINLLAKRVLAKLEQATRGQK